ncbi:MAG: hypothetical protein EXR55_01820 [Dehalococcoidia bacterium]|nr:hypothetical protein [Dehalococcoidia bacterium]
MAKSDALAQVAAAVERLPRGLRKHIQRVRGIAVALALRHGLDPQRVDLAATACGSDAHEPSITRTKGN